MEAHKSDNEFIQALQALFEWLDRVEQILSRH